MRTRYLAGAALLLTVLTLGSPLLMPRNTLKPAPQWIWPPLSLDETFHSYEKSLPAAETLSEMNGFCGKCDRHGYVTYTFLASLSNKLPTKSDADWVALVSWCRHPDPCLRYIALDRLAAANGYGRRGLSVPSMYDPEHWEFYENLCATKEFFDQKKIQYPPALFADTLLTFTEQDFAALMNGGWEQDFGGSNSSNFKTCFAIGGGLVRKTELYLGKDPLWHDRTETYQIKEVRVNAQRQFAVEFEWVERSDSHGYHGERRPISNLVFLFWPIRKDLMWFKQDQFGYWEKMRKAGP